MNVTVNIIICDDELNFLEYLYSRVEQIMLNHGYSCKIVEFSDSYEFIQYCKKNIVDVILVDIDMPKKDGFAAVRELQKQKPDIAVIFVSAHEELAYQSFKYNPFQFVSKADLDRLEDVLVYLMRKVRRRREHKDIIHIKLVENIIDINVNEVMYLRSDKNYITAYDEKEQALLRFRGVLKNMYTELSNYGFVYTHKRYIINCRFIQKFENRKVILTNDKEITGTRNTEIITEAKKLYGKFMREERW